MDDSTLGIEAVGYPVEVSSIRLFVPSPNGPGEEVCNLDQPGCGRVHEQRHFGEIAQIAPSGAMLAETSGQPLQCVLVVRFVHYNQAAGLAAFPVMQARQVEIEAIAYLFKRPLDGIVRGDRLFIHGHSKRSNTPMRVL